MAQLESQELPLKTTCGHPTQYPVGHWDVKEQRINRVLVILHLPHPNSLSNPYCLFCVPGGWQVTSPGHPSWLASTRTWPVGCSGRKSERRKRERGWDASLPPLLWCRISRNGSLVPWPQLLLGRPFSMVPALPGLHWHHFPSLPLWLPGGIRVLLLLVSGHLNTLAWSLSLPLRLYNNFYINISLVEISE